MHALSFGRSEPCNNIRLGLCRYISNTRIKLMLIVDDHVARDEEMRQVACLSHNILSACSMLMCHDA